MPTAGSTLDYTLRQADWRTDLWGSFTILDGNLTDERTDLNYEPPFTSKEMFKTGLTANYRDRIIFTPSVAWNGPQNGFVTSTSSAFFGQKVPSHTVVNLFAEVRGKNQMVSAYLQVANLLDSRYYNAGQGSAHTFLNSPQDPRWIMGGIKIRF